MKLNFKALAPVIPLGVIVLLYKQTVKPTTASGDEQQQPSLKTSGKVSVDKRFMEQLQYILKICIPSLRSSTSLIIILHSVFLVLRTYLSVVVARIDGKLVKDLVGANGKEFLKGLSYWFLIAIPATFTNSMIRYFQTKLSLSLRQSLTSYIHDVYLSNKTFYKAIQIDNRVESADQLITTDVKKFCDALASLYSNIGKPLLDLIIFNYQLARSIGITGMIGLSVNYYITASLMKAVTPPFGKFAAEEAKLEGEFRQAHGRIITNAEEIAFYRGGNREKLILDSTYTALIKHINKTLQVKMPYHMFEDFIIKYSWSAVGLIISSIPVFFPEYAGARTLREEAIIDSESVNADTKSALKAGNRTQGFITNKRLLISLADAGGRIMYSYKELSELAGHTFRVYNTLKIFESLKENKYSAKPSALGYDINDLKGELEYGFKGITFQHAPIVTPTGDNLLVDDLSFELLPGDHLMITGPNGAGKSSILRVLSGLWPLFDGYLRRPNPGLENILFLPQKPYLVLGTLRDQIIYPHSVEQMVLSGYQDSDLMDILKLVYLDYIPSREGGFDAKKEWKDVLSGGEKQRMQLARVFYHCPRFVVLDESTSAVSNDVESLLYGTAKEEGITIITISHRPALFKYHTLLLKLGLGPSARQWSIERIGTQDKLLKSIDAEIQAIEEKIAKSAQIKKRLDEINRELLFQQRPTNENIAKRNLIKS